MINIRLTMVGTRTYPTVLSGGNVTRKAGEMRMSNMEQVDLQPVDRKSLAHFASEDRASLDDWIQGNGYMFFQDVHTQIMPYRPERRPDFLIDVTPDENMTKERVMAIFSPNEPSYRDLTEHLSDFIRDVAGQIAFWGTVHYEITQVEAVPSETQWRRSFRGIPVGERLHVPMRIPGRVYTIGTRLFQIIPKAERAKGRPLMISLPKSRVWSIGVPDLLGGM